MQKQLDAARKSPPRIVVEDDMDTTVAAPPGRSLESLRNMLSAAKKNGMDDAAPGVVAWKAEIAEKQAEKQAAKPLYLQIKDADQAIAKKETALAKMQDDVQGYLDDIACAQKRLELHRASIEDASGQAGQSSYQEDRARQL